MALLLLCAHHTSYFCSIEVWRASYSITSSFHEVEQGICILSWTSSYWLCTHINTNRDSASVIRMVLVSHKVTIIFSGPWRRAGCSSWDDDLGKACRSIAHCTWRIMAKPITEGWGSITSFIFRSIKSSTSFLKSTSGSKELWLLMKTEVFSTSCLIPPTSCHASMIKSLGSTGTTGPPPSCEDHSSYTLSWSI